MKFTYCKVAGRRDMRLEPWRVPNMLQAMLCRATWEGVIVRLDWPALTPALAEIRIFDRPVPSVAPIASSLRPALTRICGRAASWLFDSRRQAHFLREYSVADFLTPNVRVKPAPAV